MESVIYYEWDMNITDIWEGENSTSDISDIWEAFLVKDLKSKVKIAPLTDVTIKQQGVRGRGGGRRSCPNMPVFEEHEYQFGLSTWTIVGNFVGKVRRKWRIINIIYQDIRWRLQ